MKNLDIVNPIAIKTLQRLDAERLPAATSFIVHMNLKALSDINRVFSEKRDALVLKYAKKDEEGKPMHPTDQGEDNASRVIIDDIPAFEKELQELLDVDVDVKITKIKPKQLGDVLITPSEIGSISWMIDPSE